MTDPAFPDALPASSRLHWYVVERVLGQGGFGITYLARDTNLDQAVAIKEYLPVDVATRMKDTTIRARTDDLRDRYRWGLERFIQEARTLARFDHPNIVRVQSVFEFNNTAYMVMRFEQGLTLSALLDRRGTLPERELLRIVTPILDGLELVHNAGFIHRDIKPDNIHINDDGAPVLLDFGSARQALGNSHTLTILIAPGYAPFEQYYSDSSSQGPWTDIYGLGATCYRAISGRAPLDAVSRSKGILGSTQEVLVPASVIGAGRYSGNFLAAIDHALAFAEKDRPQSIAAWRQELVAEHTQPPAATEMVSTPVSSARPMNALPMVAAADAAIAPSVAADARRSAPQPAKRHELPDTKHPAPSGNRRPLMVGLVATAAILAVGIAAYVATMQSGGETRNKIAALEKQLQDGERAQAERDRSAQQQADEEARKRQVQARAEQERSDAEIARKREEEQKRQEEQKRREIATTKVSPKEEARTRQPPATSIPKASPEPPVAIPREPAVSQPAPAAQPPELAKPSPPRAPTDQIADADRAIASKQYAEALAVLTRLADAGNAQAQSRLGNAYADGTGVTQDYAAAVKWYEKAALQREIGAQLKLGAMYAHGTGVARDNNLAYLWYGMAALLGSAAAKSEREKVSVLLQPAERDQADRLVEKKFGPLSK